MIEDQSTQARLERILGGLCPCHGVHFNVTDPNTYITTDGEYFQFAECSHEKCRIEVAYFPTRAAIELTKQWEFLLHQVNGKAEVVSIGDKS